MEPSPLLNAVLRYLKTQKLKHHVHPRLDVIEFGIRGKNLGWMTQVRVQPRLDTIAVRCPLGPLGPEGVRPALADLVARLNERSRLGHWDLDMTTGDVAFRNTVDVEGLKTVPAGMIRALFNAAFSAVDHHAPALMRVAYAGVPPAEALTEPTPAIRPSTPSGEDDDIPFDVGVDLDGDVDELMSEAPPEDGDEVGELRRALDAKLRASKAPTRKKAKAPRKRRTPAPPQGASERPSREDGHDDD